MDFSAPSGSGFFSGLVAGEPAFAGWGCTCVSCEGEAVVEGSGGAGAIGPGGDYATTPNDNAYRYVSQAPDQGSGGSVAPLMAGSKWASLDSASAKTIITFSFADPRTSVFNYANGDNFAATLRAFSESDRSLVRELLGKIEAVCNVDFVEVADNASQCGVIRYGYSDRPTQLNYAGYAFYPSASAIGGDVWIASAQAGSQWDFYRPNLLLHETLHALGLKHPFSGGSVLAADQDVIANTVMSYSPVAGSTSGSLAHYPGEPMPYDIAALQHLYGMSAQNAGDTVYDLASGAFQAGFTALWDAGGCDTLDASRVRSGVTLDLNGGARSDIGASVAAQARRADGSSVNVTYEDTLALATGTAIEHATGSAHADRLVGNALANRLAGGGGDDRIDGGAGVDTAVFSGARAGYQVARGGEGWQVRDMRGGDGVDTLVNVERLQFADGTLALDVAGNAGAAVRVLGTVFGAPMAQNESLRGVAVSLLDAGMGKCDLVQLALNVRLGGGASNASVVDLLFNNLVGRAPTEGERAPFVSLLDSGRASAAGFALSLAESALVEAKVGLMGAASSGLAYC